jgi:hypothetical protein
MDGFALYFFIGMVFAFMMESMLVMAGDKFTWSERLFLIVLWPIGVLSFLIQLFK